MLPTIHMPLQMFGCKNLCLNDLQLVLGGNFFGTDLKRIHLNTDRDAPAATVCMTVVAGASLYWCMIHDFL